MKLCADIDEGKTITELKRRLAKQRYHFIGNLAAVKACRWLHESLVNGKACYKQVFYGISSHRCVQFSASPFHCTQRCVFCWRMQPGDVGAAWNELQLKTPDDPEQIVAAAIEEQRRLVSGYKGNPMVPRRRHEEACDPRHVAISLAGEPTLYPDLGSLIDCFRQRGLTSFLVTNGTKPDALAGLATEPSQLYVTVAAPSEAIYQAVCNPLVKDGWKSLKATLEILSSFSCPTVIRLTLAKGLNMLMPEAYSKLILSSEATYVEAKAYMHVGYSTGRMGFQNMPTHGEIAAFALELSRLTGYSLIDQQRESRVALLSRLEKPIRLG